MRTARETETQIRDPASDVGRGADECLRRSCTAAVRAGRASGAGTRTGCGRQRAGAGPDPAAGSRTDIGWGARRAAQQGAGSQRTRRTGVLDLERRTQGRRAATQRLQPEPLRPEYALRVHVSSRLFLRRNV